MKILLCCGAGASSGFMAQSMRKAAKARNLDIQIVARSDSELETAILDADILMIGPHRGFNTEYVEKVCNGKPYIVINKTIYGNLDGEAALDEALSKLKEKGLEPSTKIETKKEKKEDKKMSEKKQNKFFDWMETKFTPALNKVCANDYVASIQGSIMATLPMILLGSLTSLVDVLRNWFPFIPSIGILNTYSFGLMSLFMSFTLPLKIMEKKHNEKLKWGAGLSGLALYLLISLPTSGEEGTLNILADKLGTGGMLVSILSGVFVGFVFSFMSKHSVFSEDTQIPDIVVNWTDVMIAAVVCLIPGIILFNTNTDLCLIIRALYSPVTNFAQTLPGMIVVSLAPAFLYTFGITWVLFPVTWSIWMAGIDANIAAGAAATNLCIMETYHGIMFIGGTGATLMLNIMMLRSKSKRLKTISRVSLVPSIFNINEPLLFGAPVVWNPPLMIGFILQATILPILMWAGFQTGLVPVPCQPMQLWYLPIYIQAYLATKSIAGVVLCLVLTVASYFIWLPFYKIYEKQVLAEEEKEQQSIEAKATNLA